MARRNQSQQGDEPLQVDLDSFFVGVNNRLDPALLGAGEGTGLVADAWNCRFNSGRIEPRPGCTTPVHFNPTFAALRGAGVFADPTGTEVLIAVDASTVWALAHGQTPVRVSLPEGTLFSGPVDVVQAFDNVILFRGKDTETLQWNGIPDERFRAVSTPDPRYDSSETPTFLSPTPNAEFGIIAADRLFVPTERDTVVWSDVLRYDAFDLALNQVRLNQGEDDAIVALLALESSILVFKTQSIYRLAGVVGDMSQLTTERINGGLGAIARKSVVQIGADVIWLAQGGVYRLQQVFETRIASVPVPVSDSIARTIGRINWLAAHKACGVLCGNYYWLAVPIDGSAENNCILIYDVTTNQWQGVDTFGAPPEEQAEEEAFAGFPVISWDSYQGLQNLISPSVPVNPIVRMQAIVKTTLNGVRTPFLIDAARILALNTGKADHISGNYYPIHTRYDLRGYRLGNIGLTSLKSFTLDYSSWNSQFSIWALADGVSEQQALALNVTPSRFESTRFDVPNWTPSNANNDFSSPHRKDYAWCPGDATAVGTRGLPVFLPQAFTATYPARLQGQWMTLRVHVKRGWFALHRAAADGVSPRSNLHTRD